MSLLRRARGALGIAIFWGIAWATCGVALAAWRVFFGRPQLADPSRYVGRFMWVGGLTLGLCGLVAGAAFALALSRTARGRDVTALSPLRATLWGALAGAVPAVVTMPLLGVFPVPIVLLVTGVMAATGAAFAFGTVRVAQGGAPPIGRISPSDVADDLSTIVRRPT